MLIHHRTNYCTCGGLSIEAPAHNSVVVQVLQGAVCPEVKMGLDDAVSAIASVTEVSMSNDLQVAKVYISVYSDPHGRDIAMKGLSRLEGYVSAPARNQQVECCTHVCTDLPMTTC